MKKRLSYALVLALLTGYSCQKNNTTTSTPTGPLNVPDQDIALNLTYSETIDTNKNDQWEIIVSEPAGKLLLDTVCSVNTKITANLHTNSYVVNLTCVSYTSLFDDYSVVSYRNVNPRNWTYLPYPYNVGVMGDTLPQSIRTTYYTHPPALGTFESTDFNDILVSDYTWALGLAGVANYQPGDATYQPGGLLTVTNFTHADNPVYTLFPQLGLYNFHIPPTTGNDTVDLTHMDTAVMVNYALPSSAYSLSNRSLNGYADTTDLNKSMILFSTSGTLGQYPVDLEYPATGVQAYWLNLQATSTANDYIQYIGYGPKIPSSIPWLSAADYTLQSDLQDSFAVSFGPKPTFYNTTWNSGKINFVLYSAPDGTTLHPYTWLTHLGSKLLKSQSIPSITLESFYFAQAGGMPSDYIGCLNAYAAQEIENSVPYLGSSLTMYTKSW